MQFIIHYFLHFIFPVILSYACFRSQWLRTSIIFLTTMLVDLDHLLASPVYMACRCSIGYHPLHSYVAVGVYMLFLLPKASRLIALGLLMHMATDGIDCMMNTLNCN